ncbi:histidine phosphatase superfamily [Zopfochytrium polystomum]|nr:histidine phosphatase superfamily [Zopfochytrium polystomum]
MVHTRRTLQASQSLVFGFIGPALDHRKVNIHVGPKFHDPLSVSGSGCSRFDQLMKASRAPGTCRAVFDSTAARLHAEIDKLLNVSSGDRLDLERWYDIMRCRRCHSMPNPCSASGDCVSDALVSKVFLLGAWFIQHEYGLGGSTERIVPHAKDIMKLRTGPLLHHVLQQLSNGANGYGSKRYNFYSSHDTTIAALRGILGLSRQAQWPPYASSLIIEQWRVVGEDDPQIRVFYGGGVQEVPFCQTRSLPTCSWKRFSEGLEEFLPYDEVKECAVDQERLKS